MSSLDATTLSLLSSINSNPYCGSADGTLSARFSAYLAPFSETLSAVTALQALTLIPRHTIPPHSPRPSPPSLDAATSSELLVVYELCLRCLRVVSSEISCEPYTIETLWLRMVICVESCGRFLYGVREGVGILERLLGAKEDFRKEFAKVVVETGVVVVRCVVKSLGDDARGEITDKQTVC